MRLTVMECRILEQLMRAAGRPVSRDQLCLLLYRRPASPTERFIDTHIRRIRRKMGEWASMILSVRGTGYELRIPEDGRPPAAPGDRGGQERPTERFRLTLFRDAQPSQYFTKLRQPRRMAESSSTNQEPKSKMKLAILSLLTSLAMLPRMEAQPWEKPAEKWTEAEARCVLAESPWAKQTFPALHTAVIMPNNAAEGLPFPLSKLTVRWESATPMMHARRITDSIPLETDNSPVYRISIAGFRIDPQKSESVLGAAKASLQYCDREPVKMSAVRVLRDSSEALLLVIQFPKTETVRDPGVFRVLPFGLRFRPNEFHFTASVGPVEIRQKFDLRDLIFLGELAL